MESARSVSLSCYLLQLELQHFYHAFSGHFHYEELREEVDFLQSVWLFHQMKRAYLERVLLSSKKAVYTRGHILLREGEQPAFLLVLMKGEVALSTVKNGQRHCFCICSEKETCGAE